MTLLTAWLRVTRRHRPDHLNRPFPAALTGVPLAGLALLTACSSAPTVDYGPTGSDGAPAADALVVYAGDGADRDILQRAADALRPRGVRLTIRDAADDSNDRISGAQRGKDGGDLAFFQHTPAFRADIERRRITDLSVVASVNVIPYALYSSKWRNLDETQSWVNTGLVDDEIRGRSLPHGSQIALPATPTGFARGLYLLQAANLVRLDRPFGGTTAADLTVGQANVLDSQRHLSLASLNLDEFVADIYRNYDGVVLTPAQAESIGLVPDRDALIVEPGPKNPYAHVLVAPSRLAGDPRLLELTRELEGPATADFLATRYHGANIAAPAPA